MIKSMTGFGSRKMETSILGNIYVDIRSTNHKFLDIAVHLPEGFLSLEDKIKKEIEARIKRGRVTCVVNMVRKQAPAVLINKELLKNYILGLKGIKKQFAVQNDIGLDTLINLPGVISLSESRIPSQRLWPRLKVLVNQALDNLMKMRTKEGQALSGYLKNRAQAMENSIKTIAALFKRTIKDKLASLNSDEERSSFLRETDITEEIERLTFHIRNFKHKLSQNGAVGKELDFIAQEMQREANTVGAKSSSSAISARIVQIKSQVEKVREQVQNIE